MTYRPPVTYRLDHAWLPGPSGLEEVRSDVVVTVSEGRIVSVEDARDARPDPAAVRLAGLTLPGFANGHSHAFHRALRGRTQRGEGSFWTWREQMYDLAGRLDPDGYRTLATAVFREMASAGYTAVGEFHYLHHQPDGSPYSDPNVMAEALVEAAAAAGVRLALLDTCYLSAGLATDGSPLPVEGVQRRFSDGTAEAWQERTDELTAELGGDVVVGAALHSVRAVPLRDMRLVAEWADRFETPLHVHLSEQVAENEQCLAAYGRTPTEVLDEAGALTDHTTAVHATHLTGTDVGRLGAAGVRGLLLPHHRARPRRRDRTLPRARAGGREPHGRLRQPRRRRPLRGDAGGRARRAAARPGPRPLARGRPPAGRQRRRTPAPSVSVTPAGSCREPAPTSSRST